MSTWHRPLGQITRQTRSTVAGTPCRSWHLPEDVLILSASQLLLSLACHRQKLGMQVTLESIDAMAALQPGSPILGHRFSRLQYLLIDSTDSIQYPPEQGNQNGSIGPSKEPITKGAGTHLELDSPEFSPQADIHLYLANPATTVTPRSLRFRRPVLAPFCDCPYDRRPHPAGTPLPLGAAGVS